MADYEPSEETAGLLDTLGKLTDALKAGVNAARDAVAAGRGDKDADVAALIPSRDQLNSARDSIKKHLRKIIGHSKKALNHGHANVDAKSKRAADAAKKDKGKTHPDPQAHEGDDRPSYGKVQVHKGKTLDVKGKVDGKPATTRLLPNDRYSVGTDKAKRTYLRKGSSGRKFVVDPGEVGKL